MGLDSVELLMTFEEKFKISIPDKDAEKVITVGDMATWFYNNLKIHYPENQIKENIFDKIKVSIKDLRISEQIFSEQRMNEIFPKSNLKTIWLDFEKSLDLKLPELNKNDFKEDLNRDRTILGLKIFQPKTPFLDNDFNRLIECVGGLNYEKIVDFDRITSLFEITIAIMGITHYQCMNPIEEIFWESGFVYDLGIN
ncbi:MAG: phosphopantetheine-binding protein [Chitinophagaceae bacterium]|nr:phosphopantetheine-binding protein [Chitinophagaceae bacterium]